MELSVYSNFFADLPLADALSKIAEAGFRHVELAEPHPFPGAKGAALMRRIRALRTHADRIGVRLHQAHGYWGEFLKPGSPEWKRRIAVFNEEIAVAADLGVEAIVAHPMNKTKIEKGNPLSDPLASQEMVRNYNARFFSAVIPSLEKHGVKVAIENMPGRHEGFTTIDELLELVDTLDSDRFGICLDTGHLNQASGDFVRFISKAGERLIATHIQDCLNIPGADLHLFPLFSSYGSWIDWRVVRDSLRGIGYEGCFNFETPGEGPSAGVPLWMREKKLKFVFECVTKFLSE